MQDEIIKVCSDRLTRPLPKELISKIRNSKWSYMGLEMIIDTVKAIEITELEGYLSRLD